MTKQSVNLIIRREPESLIVRRLKIILPLTAVISLALFLIGLFTLLAYIARHKSQFETLKTEVSELEKKIAGQKNIEGIYAYTAIRLGILDKILSAKKNYFPLISVIDNLQMEGISITSVATDNVGNISLAIIASSSATLDNFADTLIAYEKEKLFSDIYASGIVREKKGNYSLMVSLKGNPSLLK